jgi:hypothetical protein
MRMAMAQLRATQDHKFVRRGLSEKNSFPSNKNSKLRFGAIGASARSAEASNLKNFNFEKLRWEKDLNPRYPFGYTAFRVRPIRPLWHPTVLLNL